MKIYKYELKRASTQFVQIPEKSSIIDIQIQKGKIMMWAEVEPDSPEIDIKINMYGTGQEVAENGCDTDYLGTIQDGDNVWHFYMMYEN